MDQATTLAPLAISETAAEPTVSVVIAALNEAENIEPLIHEVVAAFDAEAGIEIIVVDDGSTDATASRVAALAAEIGGIRLLRHQRRAGQSVALATGVRAARAAYVVTLDGDGQNDPYDAPAMLEIARRTGPALIAGVRLNRADKWSKRAASRFANGFRRAMLHDGCPDTGCGLKVFPRDAFLRLPLFDGLHRYLPALFATLGLPVVLHPVTHRPRLRGVSKYNNLGRALLGIVDVFGVVWLRRRIRQTGRVTEG